jgi:hypothetical protein
MREVIRLVAGPVTLNWTIRHRDLIRHVIRDLCIIGDPCSPDGA